MPRLIFNKKIRYYDLAKLTHEYNHYWKWNKKGKAASKGNIIKQVITMGYYGILEDNVEIICLPEGQGRWGIYLSSPVIDWGLL